MSYNLGAPFYRLGLKEPHPVTLRLPLKNYCKATPLAPRSCDWSQGIADWGMLANDKVGLCGIDGPLHQIMAWTQAATGMGVSFTDAQAIAEYQAVTAAEGAEYDPVTGINDNGVVLQDVLQRWQQVGLAGHQIAGWVDGQAGDLNETCWGASQFGGCNVALALPLTAQAQLAAGQIWSLRARFSAQGQPGSWGRHDVYLVNYTPQLIGLVTWGAIQFCTPEWLEYYCCEVHFPVSKDFLGATGLSPNHLDLTGLLQGLAQLGPVL